MATKPPQKEAIEISGQAGSIECLLETPAELAPRGKALICHPHPLHGGTMQNKVAHTLARAAVDCGLAAMRFNFRGVGASAGVHDNGFGERDDALLVADYLNQRFDGPIVFAGFSFGGGVATEIARRQLPVALVTAAPAVDRWERDADWQQPACPWLIVHGDADELVDVDAVVSFVDGLSPGPELLVMPEVSHFFHGQLVELRTTVTAFINAALGGTSV
ncbi:MAG: alpha/beta family hydrolase [Pseudomonadota bacterium]